MKSKPDMGVGRGVPFMVGNRRGSCDEMMLKHRQNAARIGDGQAHTILSMRRVRTVL